MNRLSLTLAFAFCLLCSPLVSCTPTASAQGEGRATGIKASEAGGFNRQDIYQLQDRTFRQLAY